MLDFRKYREILFDVATLKFAVVGVGGFLVNASCLFVLHSHLKMALIPAQVISSEAAILFNYVLHDNWTYKKSESLSFQKRILEFHGSSWGGAAITLAVLYLATSIFNLQYLLALGVGGAIAMAWNYAWTRFVIWKPRLKENQ